STKPTACPSPSGWWRSRSRSSSRARSRCGFRDDVRRPRRARACAAHRRCRVVRRGLGAARPHPTRRAVVARDGAAGGRRARPSASGSALARYLDALDSDVAYQGGPGLAPALRQGGELLQGSSELADRVLVVFTDGEAHDSLPPIAAQAERLKVDGIRLILV